MVLLRGQRSHRGAGSPWGAAPQLCPRGLGTRPGPGRSTRLPQSAAMGARTEVLGAAGPAQGLTASLEAHLHLGHPDGG